jgi:hypothetical protein
MRPEFGPVDLFKIPSLADWKGFRPKPDHAADLVVVRQVHFVLYVPLSDVCGKGRGGQGEVNDWGRPAGLEGGLVARIDQAEAGPVDEVFHLQTPWIGNLALPEGTVQIGIYRRIMVGIIGTGFLNGFHPIRFFNRSIYVKVDRQKEYL